MFTRAGDDVQLVPAGGDDLPWIVALERESDTERWILPWSLAEHQAAGIDPDLAERVIQRGGRRAGFALLAGVRNAHRAVELRRLVVAPEYRGQGVAASALARIAQWAFHGLGAHRLWLDVKCSNDRARALYRAAGFQEEGVLRQCLMGSAGWESLVVMSLLEDEWWRLQHQPSSTNTENP
jgi:RimJ/RimL family protein N-acetyltransferase